MSYNAQIGSDYIYMIRILLMTRLRRVYIWKCLVWVHTAKWTEYDHLLMMRMLRLSTCKCLVWVNTAISTLKHHLPMTHVVSNCKLFTFLSSIYLDFIGLTDLVELYVGFSVFQEQHYIIIQFKVIEGLCQDTIIIRKSDKIKVDNNLSPF